MVIWRQRYAKFSNWQGLSRKICIRAENHSQNSPDPPELPDSCLLPPLLSWHAEPDEIRPIPDAAEAALSPQDTKTIDQLYLTGLHLEQYRHATWSALDYYEEALRRDPMDYRCNMQTGLWYLRLFWKSTWNKAWADAGYYEAACISAADHRWEDALDEVERMADMMHDNVYNYHEVALDYQQAGLSDEARLVLQTAIDRHVEESPLTYYYMAFSSKISESPLWWKRAMKASPDYCFPNRLEDAFILRGLTMAPGIDARAHYYLGCLYYDKRQYDLATRNWERAVEIDPDFPTAWRCLALARFNKQDRHEEAVEYMERAFSPLTPVS